MSTGGATPYRRSRASRSSTPWSQRSVLTTASMDDASSDLDDNLSTLSNTRPPTSRRTRAAASTTTGPLRDQQIICALTESRGISPTVGLAFVNLSTAEAVLCQIADNQTYVKTLHKLTVFDPSEILFASFAGGVQKSKLLLQVLEGNLTGAAPVRAIHRKYWDETTGVTYVQNLAFIEDVEAIKVSIGGNFYATCCFAAAMKYVEISLNISFAYHSMRIKYEPSEGAMMIDVSTIQALELIQNAQNLRSSDSLFGLLDQTLTKMGARLLRSSILQPLIEPEIIEKRHDALEELTTHDDIFVAVRRALKVFQDVDRTLTNMVIIDQRPSVRQWEQSINNVLVLKHYLRAVPAVYEALNGAASELLLSIRQFCAPENLAAVTRLINHIINEDVTYEAKPLQLRNQRVYAVKAGVNGLLDVARQTYKEANHDAYQLMLDLQQTHGVSLEMKYDGSRHTYFVIRAGELEQRALPDVFINRFRKKNVIECQTLELMKLNQKILDSSNEAMHLSDDLIQQLIEDIRAIIAPHFRISDGIAVLDMLAAFAQVATSQDYTRPEFSSTLAIKNGRHPIAEKLCTEKFVPNDVYATASKRLHIVTGCNMSGKSTYIRAIALMTIMAQIGCFVPADVASFYIRHQLFARVSIDDSATSNVSTFAAEMRETAFILKNITSQSLVIVDELGRGTSTRDGLAIAVAVAEALIQSRALIWFVTHFRDLPVILAEREGVETLHLRTTRRPNATSLAMLYEVAEGPVDEFYYGLALARAVGLPEDALEVATRVAHQLEARAQHRREHPPMAVVQARRSRLVLGVREQLVQAKEGDLEGEELRKWLKSLQDEFVRRMSAIDEYEGNARNAWRGGGGGGGGSGETSNAIHHEVRAYDTSDEPTSSQPPAPAPVLAPAAFPACDIRAYLARPAVRSGPASPTAPLNHPADSAVQSNPNLHHPLDPSNRSIGSTIARRLAAEGRQPSGVVLRSPRNSTVADGGVGRPITVSSSVSMTGSEDEDDEILELASQARSGMRDHDDGKDMDMEDVEDQGSANLDAELADMLMEDWGGRPMMSGAIP